MELNKFHQKIKSKVKQLQEEEYEDKDKVDKEIIPANDYINREEDMDEIDLKELLSTITDKHSKYLISK